MNDREAKGLTQKISQEVKLALSLAMCTYNGELYLWEQLVTRLPDGLIVCGDGSTNVTLKILEDSQKESPFPVKVYRNEEDLGPTKNFEKAVGLRSGDVIILSDQDDVWLPEKLERIEKAFKEHPEAGYVFSDALVVNP